jgi:putative ABC transport system permease protein
MGDRLGYLRLAPWRRAPLLLFRRPAVAIAIAVSAAVLGIAAAATPLFLSSAGNATLHLELAQGCQYAAGGTVGATQQLAPGVPDPNTGPARPGTADPARYYAQRDRIARDVLGSVPGITGVVAGMAPNGHVDVTPVGHPPANANSTGAVLLSRDGFRQHIRVLSRASGSAARDGVWVPGDFARQLGVRPGDPLELSSFVQGSNGVASQTSTASTVVAGTYRDLLTSPRVPYWCSQARTVYAEGHDPFSSAPIYPVLLMDNATLVRLGHPLGLFAYETWEAPVAGGGLTVQHATAVGAALNGVPARLFEHSLYFSAEYPVAATYRTDLPSMAERAAFVRESVSSTVLPIALAGVGVALLVVAAAASYWVDRRRGEVDLLISRGVGPAGLAAKATLEMLPATVIGLLGGWGLAILLVRAVGPSPLLDAGAPWTALLRVLPALVAAVLVLAVVTGARTRAVAEKVRGARRSRWLLVPWELLAVGAAAALLVVLVRRGTQVDSFSFGSVARVDPVLLAFPLLFLLGAVVLVARLFEPPLRRIGRGGRRLRPPAYLASRRVAGAPLVSLLLIAATALPVGVLAYGSTITSSMRLTLAAKTHLFVGSDLKVQLPYDAKVPASLGRDVTEVRYLDDRLLDGTEVDIIGVDPATFPRQAYWRSAFADRSLPDLMRLLSGPEVDGRPPVLVARGSSGRSFATGDATLGLQGEAADSGTKQVPVRVVASTRDFPGEAHDRPLVVMDKARLAPISTLGFRQLWAAGDADRSAALIASHGVQATFPVRASSVLDASTYLPVTYTFELLQALAYLTGAVALGGLLLYVESRTRARRVAYVFVRRMGLSRLGHFRSVVAEIGGLLLLGLAVGLGLAAAASFGAYRTLDVAPDLPPGPLIETPWVRLGLLALAVAVIAVLVSAYAQHAADRSRPAEVLRDPG